MSTKIKTAKGRVTRYGFMCGTTEEWYSKDDRYRITFEQDGINWRVNVRDRKLNINLEEEIFPVSRSIHYPRKAYDDFIKKYGVRLTKCEIIRETKEFYEVDPYNRRGIHKDYAGNFQCRYITRHGKRCAIGRCLVDPPFGVMGVTQILHDFELLPQYKGHDEGFWGELQDFHDRSYYWTTNSISDRGIERYNSLMKRYQTEYDKETGIVEARCPHP